MPKKSPEKKAGSQSILKRAAIFGVLSLAAHSAPIAKPAYEFLAPEIRDTLSAKVRNVRANLRSAGKEKRPVDTSKVKSLDRDNLSPEEYEKRRKAAEDLIIYHPEEARALVLNGTIPLDEMRINIGRFFLETEYQRGVTAEDTQERKEALEELKKEMNAELKNCKSAEDEIAMMWRYFSRYGENNTWVTDYMGDLLASEKHEGNCSARTKLKLTLLTDIDWKHVSEVKLHAMAIHIQILLKMDNGKWYTFSNFPYEIPEEDLSETAIIDKNAFIKTHLGIKSDVKVLDENKDPARSLSKAEIIAGLLLTGGAPLLLSKDLVGLRSPFDHKGPKKPDPVTNVIEIEVEENFQPPSSAESGSKETETGMSKKKPENPPYILTSKEKIDARLSGDFSLVQRNNFGHGHSFDVKQLEGIELKSLSLWEVDASDLSPIKQNRLNRIQLIMTNTQDISPLTRMPLEQVELHWTKVSDLSPLRGAPIKSIKIDSDYITDLSPLRGMPLEVVRLNLRAESDIDLSPLKDAPIKSLTLFVGSLDINSIRDLLLRLKTSMGETSDSLIVVDECHEINWDTITLEEKKDKPDFCKKLH
jgi:hypothetical protein